MLGYLEMWQCLKTVMANPTETDQRPDAYFQIGFCFRVRVEYIGNLYSLRIPKGGRRIVQVSCGRLWRAKVGDCVLYASLYEESWYHPVSKPAVKVDIPVSCKHSCASQLLMC